MVEAGRGKNCEHGPCYQAYQILHFGFTVLPMIVGLDKILFSFLTKWEQYLTPEFSFFGDHRTMMVVGVIEVIAGIGVWIMPRVFSYVVGLWLLGIIVNLVLLGDFFDVAVRDFGLMLGALALGRLASYYYSCSHKESCEI